MYYFFMGLTQLPVPPARMTVKVRSKNKVINLINEGEANLLKIPGLTEISFDVRLPNKRYPWANYDSSLMGSAVNSLARRLTGSISWTSSSSINVGVFRSALSLPAWGRAV